MSTYFSIYAKKKDEDLKKAESCFELFHLCTTAARELDETMNFIYCERTPINSHFMDKIIEVYKEEIRKNESRNNGERRMEKKLMLGNKLKDLRENNKYTQQQIADYLGLDQSTITKIEKDERSIELTRLQSLADLYGCTLHELTTTDANVKPSLAMAFRANSITTEDMRSIAQIKKLVLNLRLMEYLLEANSDQ